jgi:guanylate kinase
VEVAKKVILILSVNSNVGKGTLFEHYMIEIYLELACLPVGRGWCD